MTAIHQSYVGIPWKAGGRDRAGVDCLGLAMLWLSEELGIQLGEVRSDAGAPSPESVRWKRGALVAQSLSDVEIDCGPESLRWKRGALERGDLVFFRHVRRNEWHIAVNLGSGLLLHILQGYESRIDNGPTLLARAGLLTVGALGPRQVREALQVLGNGKLGEQLVVGLVVAIVSMAVSYALRPKSPKFKNSAGRYSDQGAVTQVNPELPLPDLLGSVVTAGNAVYTALQDWSESAGTTAKWTKIVVLGSAPFEEIDYQLGLMINGTSVASLHWSVYGIVVDPAQTRDEAVLGTIGSASNVPSVTLYEGEPGITVPVDIRANYDRTFPLSGFPGCAYLVFRLISATLFSSFNVTAKVKGRKCRAFGSAGFTVSTATAENLAGADGSKVRFKLTFEDIAAITSLTVGATSYAEISAAVNTGNVVQLNRTKGFIEFLAAPAPASTITITYTYYPRAWTSNPASQIVYLLTERARGKGLDATKIDWARAVTFRDACDTEVFWETGECASASARYSANYAIDSRRPMQEHLQSLLDASNGILFQSGGKFVLKMRTAGTTLFSFTAANILVGTFQSELIDRSERRNRIKVLLHAEENQNAETEVVVDDPADQDAREARLGNAGVSEENLKFPALTSVAQAQRLAHSILQQEVQGRWTCSLTTNVQGLALEPGDVVDVTHAAYPDWSAKLCVIEELSYDDQDRLQLRLSEYVAAALE